MVGVSVAVLYEQQQLQPPSMNNFFHLTEPLFVYFFVGESYRQFTLAFLIK